MKQPSIHTFLKKLGFGRALRRDALITIHMARSLFRNGSCDSVFLESERSLQGRVRVGNMADSFWQSFDFAMQMLIPVSMMLFPEARHRIFWIVSRPSL